MKSKLGNALNALSILNPLNPRNPLNPLRPLVVARRPPGVIPDAGHASLLALFYGDKTSLDVVPFPNMEWWWQTIDVTLAKGRTLSVISNVQLFAVPLTGWVAQGTVSIRDKASGRCWEAHTSGALDPGLSCAFSASRWSIGYTDRDYRTYAVDVRSADLDLKLALEHNATAFLGDAATPKGWYDLNPDGLVPLWASYRSRFSDTLRGPASVTLDGEQHKIEGVKARFDHQSLHMSPRDFGSYSLPALGEMAFLSPQWRWYHATFLSNGEPVNLMACEVRNGNTETVIKRAAALCDNAGGVVRIDPKTLKFKALTSSVNLAGRVAAPSEVGIEFSAPKNGLGITSGDYKLICKAEANRDWTVHYPIVGPLRYEAQEVPITLSGTAGGEEIKEGSGTQEVLDMVRSVTLG